GTMNRYVLKHLEQVKKVLQHREKSYGSEIILGDDRTAVCRKYHYGFLKLLRQKPAWKKKLKRWVYPQVRKEFMHQFDSILLDIEAEKERCDLIFFKKQKLKFKKLKRKMNYYNAPHK
ncbi:MAG: hypothetical protein L3J38_02990, partial [Thiomicrorhabdus sp.]|nr:hypothetical protein [Thiomicrorhabdus sp.]